MRYLLVVLLGISLVGCSGFRSIDVAREMEPIYQQQYEQQVRARAMVAKQVMDALKNINRGGVDIEVDNDGKIKHIRYTEHLDDKVFVRAMTVPTIQRRHIKSGLEETGEFLGSLTNIVVPLGSMYFGYKVTKSHNSVEKARINANVDIAKSQNDLLGKVVDKDPAYPPEYIVNPEEGEDDNETEE